MDETLKKQIENRKKEAGEKKLHEKATYVAIARGGHKSLNVDGRREGSEYTYLDATQAFGIAYSFGTSYSDEDEASFSGLEIRYKGALVFHEGGGTLRSYIPGQWEKHLERLVTETQKMAAKAAENARKIGAMKANTEQNREDAEERAKWGLG